MDNIGYSDRPSNVDYLGMDTKYMGLADFICTCSTPMTIALNGDWGTGKTSAMKIIRQKLIEKYDKNENNDIANIENRTDGGEAAKSIENQIIEFNTWEFSVLGQSGNLLINLLIAINEKLIDLANKYKLDGSDQNNNAVSIRRNLYRLQNLGKGIASAAYNFLDDKTGNAISGFINTFSSDPNAADNDKKMLEATNNILILGKIRDEIQNSIKAIVEKINEENNKSNDEKPPRLFIFIDDLDRLDPSVALELIEGMQNYVFCENCVFVLAVDQKVVERGLRNKYGSDFSKDMSRHFFDKIIQLPFKLPVHTYNFTNYVKELMNLNKIENTNGTAEKFARLIKIFNIDNPRTIKRSFNLLRMYQCIERAAGNVNDAIENKDLKQFSVSLLLTDEKTMNIHSQLTRHIDSSIDYNDDANESAVNDVQNNFFSLKEADPDSENGITEDDVPIIKEILAIFYGEEALGGNCVNDAEATRELISVLNLTKPQDSSYGNRSYASVIYKLISCVKDSGSFRLTVQNNDLPNAVAHSGDKNEWITALANLENTCVLSLLAVNANSFDTAKELRLTWNPALDDSVRKKLYITVWSKRINADDPFHSCPDIEEAFYKAENSEVFENNNEYPYFIIPNANDMNRITIYIRKNGDFAKLMRFLEEIGVTQAK